MALTRKQIGNIYRPQGPKAISLGNGVTPTAGGSLLVAGPQIDLSVPIEGFRLVFKLRDVIATAAMTSVNPLGYLNLISRILVTGKNSRSSGNATLWDIDLPSLALIQSTQVLRPFSYNGVIAAGTSSAGTEMTTQLGTPLSNFSNVATATYDIRIVVDLPAYPFDCAAFARPGFYLRSQEWADSLQMRFTFPSVPNGVANPLGTDAGTTTHTFTSYGSGSGTPTLDIYSLPAIMGTDLDAAMTPGFLSRVATPVSSVLQSAGGLNTRLLILEKQNTTRIWGIIGVSTVTPHLSSVSDTNMTTLGMLVGSNRTVRENDDIFAHKMDQIRRYGTPPIQGVTLLDFMPTSGGNPDSHYDAAAAGDGTTLELRGTVAGVANAYGNFIQEIEQFKPQGALYSA
jgi:hypothetical protein